MLFEPRIPQNTGNIIRTANATRSNIILVKPLGFSLASRHLKRAGLDYFEGVTVQLVDSLEEVIKENDSFFCFSTLGKRKYTDFSYPVGATLIFGAETHGLPDWIHERHSDRIGLIPMSNTARSLNLSTSVGIVVYEALRQTQILL